MPRTRCRMSARAAGVLMCLWLLTSVPSQAQAIEGLVLGGGVQGVSVEDDEGFDEGGGGLYLEIGYNPSLYFTGYLGLGAASLSGDELENNDGQGNGLSDASSAMAAAQIGLKLHVPIDRFLPYVDLAYSIFALSAEGTLFRAMDDVTAKLEYTASGGGPSIGIGGMYFLADQFAFDLSLRRYFIEVDDVEIKLGGMTLDQPSGDGVSVDAEMTQVRLGVSYFF